MKIDRRSFLTLLAGGAVGTALSPLPIKLMDDISIWSQNFRGTPIEVPVPERGPASYVDSVCTLCPGGCGISVRKIGDRAVKIEGKPGHPVNDGGVCALGLSGLQLLYGPWRVAGPKKKENGRWKKISWDRALSEIAEKLNELREAGKADAIAGIPRTGRGTVARLMQRLLAAAGSPHFFPVPTNEDAYTDAVARMFGKPGTVGFDFENSGYVLSFAAGLLDGWGSPVRMFSAHSQWKTNGIKMVQVESRLSSTAAKADQWVAVKPGTEADLALGLAHVILRDNLNAGAAANSRAFDSFEALVKKDYTPARVAAATGVKESVIVALAKEFAAASHPVAVCGRGDGQTPCDSREVMAVTALNALVGSVNRQGGMIIGPEPDYIQWARPVLDDTAQKGLAKGTKTLAGLLAGKTPDVQALFVLEANPAYTLHDATKIKAALEAVPLVVSLSSFMDETSALADYILPLPTCLERTEDVVVTAGLKTPMIGLTQPVVEPRLDTRHPGDVILDLAKAMGGTVAGSFAWSDYQNCLEETFGLVYGKLAAEGYLQKSVLETLIDTAVAVGRVDFSPVVEADKKARQNAPALVLAAYDAMRIAGGAIATPPYAMKIVPDTILKKNDLYVEINPETAQKAGLADGKAAVVETPAGKAQVRVRVTHEVAPGMVAMPRGFGHTAYDDYVSGKGVNVNDLIGPVPDPVSGLDTAWGAPAKLTKA